MAIPVELKPTEYGEPEITSSELHQRASSFRDRIGELVAENVLLREENARLREAVDAFGLREYRRACEGE
jgi:regulator of replication initiation timing